MSNDDDLRARLAADIQKMFAPPEPAEPELTAEPEPELPSKGVFIPSAGNRPDHDSAIALAEQLENARDPFAKLRKLLDQQNYQ